MPKMPNIPSREVLRIIDANLNRCREALRAVEDVFRFCLSDKPLSAQIKEMRHGLAAAAREFGPALLLTARDSATDVGRELVAKNQKREYAGTADMAAANVKRAEEALRVLAETARLAAPALAARFEKMRFEVYEIERKHLPRLWRMNRLETALLYPLVTSAISPMPLPTMVNLLVDGGVDAIQLREKTMPDGEFARLAEKIRDICRKGGALFIVNDRVGIAAAVGADGVHLGQDDMPPAYARRVLGENGIIGVSTNSLAAAKGAVAGGADYVAIGPAFASQVAPEKRAIGPEVAARVTGTLHVPVFAIGGITASRLGLLTGAGCGRVAVCTALLWAKDPAAEARKFKRILEKNFRKVSRK
jgi:thiamine-phosphate pyrophosphorylase